MRKGFIILFILAIEALAAFPQGQLNYKNIEVWGLNKKQQEVFTQKMEKLFPGMGLKSASVNVLRQNFKFKNPFVNIIPDDSVKDVFYMLISLREIPKSKFSIEKNKRKNFPIPEEWQKFLSIDEDKADLVSIEYQLLPLYFYDYLQNDSNDIKRKASISNGQQLYSIDIDKLLFLLRELRKLHTFDQEKAKQILKYSDNSKLREAAALIMMNWLDDEDVMESVLEAMFDYEINPVPRNVVQGYVNSRCLEGKKSPFDVTAHVELFHFLLNLPNPNDLKTIIAFIKCGEGSEYLKYRRTDLFIKNMPVLEDMLNSSIPQFPAMAIDFLRRFSDGDYGADKEKWLVWLRSFYRK